ncbi:MAG TPA: DUF433 domain-containing protein [Pirellulales bacterium]|nr:DUF433 domain-containing protein [Pirellulales bacterium]
MASGLEKQHIEITPGVCGGKPRVAGTRIRVQDVYVWHELLGKSADVIAAEYPQLTVADVYAALAYFWDHRAEIELQMQSEENFVAKMQAALGAGPLDLKPPAGDSGHAPVSS